MDSTYAHRLRRLGVVLVLVGSFAAIPISASGADTNVWKWGCYAYDVRMRDAGFTPDPSGFYPWLADEAPRTERRAAIPKWGCYPNAATPDPSGFMPDPSALVSFWWGDLPTGR